MNRPPAWSGLPLVRFVTGRAERRDFGTLVSDPDQDALTFTAMGALPSGVTVDSAARQFVWSGTGMIATTMGLRLSANDGRGGTTLSPAFSIEIAAPSTRTPVVTRNLAFENQAGHDGTICWQSVFLLNDGRIASFGTGNHAPEQSNAMRIIDPVSMPGQLVYSEAFPWTQSGGSNLYVSNYDNHASIYLPPENKVLWVNHGVFDFATNTWTYGDRPPLTQRWDAFVDISGSAGFSGVYNPATAWCAGASVAAFYGNSGGGYGPMNDDLVLMSRTAAGSSHTYRLSTYDPGATGIQNGRNGAVCVGSTLYVAAPAVGTSTWTFQKIDVSTKQLQAALTAPDGSGEYFPQLVHDTARNRLVLLGERVQLYSFMANTWEDVTPAGWVPMRCTNAVYHPTLDAIFFRGDPETNIAEGFRWHRMVFND